ncbi:MAG TPA: DUF6689 family protein [Luteimonas sp.]|nr:DUF6689 family protein [Luteimonas sp.]
MNRAVISRWLLAIALLLCTPLAFAVDLPVSVTVVGNVATAQIGSPANPIAELTLSFDDASGLTPASLGIRASTVDITDPALLSRLPDLRLVRPESALPLLVTIEPPATGGLSFRRSGRFELHTHALAYSLGSNFRVFKAPIGGQFHDTTEEIAQGSVRARSRYGGFSQFIIATDLRETGTVVAAKIASLRTRVASLPASEQPVFTAQLDTVESAVASQDYATALAAIDLISDRAQARAGNGLLDEWRATRDADNQAGELLAGAATLKFSVAYLRDYGQ